jgi:hypothetical protein
MPFIVKQRQAGGAYGCAEFDHHYHHELLR